MTDAERRGLPRISLRNDEGEVVAALRAIQETVLRHPVAAQAAFAALVAEGRRFAETPEGARWKERLARSVLLHEARLVWRMATLSSLEEDPPDVLPSAYLDGLFLAASGDPDRVMDRLFGGSGGDPEDK